MPANTHYDVIIIGTGAGGGTLAWKLAPSGKRILLLERGDYIARDKRNWDSGAVVRDGLYNARDTWRDQHGESFMPGTHYNVGGNTKFYGAALFRMRERDFGRVAHAGGVSPAWPIAYADLEPYYTEAEALYHVHGERGADPTEPPASGPYPYPPMTHEPRLQQLHDDLVRLGHRPFHVPVGVLRDEANPRTSACIRCDTCDGFPCLVNAKADAQVICVDPALAHPDVTLITNAFVSRLETDAAGRTVRAVHVERQGEPLRFSADLVVSACGAINSAALLLRSANDAHPRGLANGSDVVGRHYMCHLNTMFLAISRERNDTRFNKSIAFNDFYFGGDDWEYPMGHVSMMGNIDGNVLRMGAPRVVPGMTLELMADHALPFWTTSEDLPSRDNRVTLDRDGAVRLTYNPTNEESHRRLLAKLKSILKHIDCEEHILPLTAYVPGRIPLAGVAHQNGTIRFGTDPRTSALDLHCKAHELDNLYVVDSSFFPSSSAVNPALTIMANALRVGDHLLSRI